MPVLIKGKPFHLCTKFSPCWNAQEFCFSTPQQGDISWASFSAFLLVILLGMVFHTYHLHFFTFIFLSQSIEILLSPPHLWNCFVKIISHYILLDFSAVFCSFYLLILGKLSLLTFRGTVLLIFSFSLVMPDSPLLVSPNLYNLLSWNTAELSFQIFILHKFTS